MTDDFRAEICCETKQFEMKSTGWTIKFGRPQYFFDSRHTWKIFRASRNAVATPSKRRRSYWTNVARKLSN